MRQSILRSTAFSSSGVAAVLWPAKYLYAWSSLTVSDLSSAASSWVMSWASCGMEASGTAVAEGFSSVPIMCLCVCVSRRNE